MATALRRRALGNESPSETPTLTPRDQSPARPGDKVKIIHHRAKTRKRRNTFIFLLGSLFGIITAGFLARNNDLIDFPELGELSMDSLLDVLPAGLVKDMRDLVVSMLCGLVPWRLACSWRLIIRLCRKASAISSTAMTRSP